MLLTSLEVGLCLVFILCFCSSIYVEIGIYEKMQSQVFLAIVFFFFFLLQLYGENTA